MGAYYTNDLFIAWYNRRRMTPKIMDFFYDIPEPLVHRYLKKETVVPLRVIQMIRITKHETQKLKTENG